MANCQPVGKAKQRRSQTYQRHRSVPQSGSSLPGLELTTPCPQFPSLARNLSRKATRRPSDVFSLKCCMRKSGSTAVPRRAASWQLHFTDLRSPWLALPPAAHLDRPMMRRAPQTVSVAQLLSLWRYLGAGPQLQPVTHVDCMTGYRETTRVTM